MLPLGIPKDFVEKQTAVILNSYRHWTGRELLPLSSAEPDLTTALFFAPFVVASSNSATDPILNYGNAQALKLWEMPWNQLTRTPGRHTAEPMHRDERQKFLYAVQKNGFIENYSGIRISSTGRRFKIEKATVWNLVDQDGKFLGQAATFKEWSYL